jgi:hypothetical protein
MLAGDKQLLAASSLLDFAEYKKLVALCGLNMFHTLERLPPHEKVECFVRTMTAAVPELDRRHPRPSQPCDQLRVRQGPRAF